MLTSRAKRFSSEALSSEVLPRWRTLTATIRSPYLEHQYTLNKQILLNNPAPDTSFSLPLPSFKTMEEVTLITKEKTQLISKQNFQMY